MDWREQLSEIKNTLVEREEVFDAVRRGYSDLENSSNDEILEYFSLSSPEELKGHVSNIKGVLFEQEVQDKLATAGINSELHEEINHPDTDLQILDDGTVVDEVQLKATDCNSYINETLSENPDTLIVATTEVANEAGKDEVIDSGISDTLLEETVVETISPIPTSVTGLVIKIGLAVLTGGLLS
jgi:hypothetical protein